MCIICVHIQRNYLSITENQFELVHVVCSILGAVQAHCYVASYCILNLLRAFDIA